MEHIGARVRAYRRRRKMSVAGLARQAGATTRYVEMIEAGSRTPSIPTLFRLAAALGIEPHALLSGDPEEIENGPAILVAAAP